MMIFIISVYLYVRLIMITQGKEYSCFLLCLALDAYESAKLLCEQYYLGAPELELREVNGGTHTYHTLTVCIYGQ